jgi:7-carboxy-7-deazaguanine synthase
VETNGTLPVPEGVDWVCVSPKAGTNIVVAKGDELKVVFPQTTDPRTYDQLDFEHFLIQPMDGPLQAQNVNASVEFCLANPKWRLSLQTHKILGVR